MKFFALLALIAIPALAERIELEIDPAATKVNWTLGFNYNTAKLLSVYALMNWPPYAVYSATEAACLSAAQSLRADLRPGGVKVLNVFSGPLETEWFQTLPPPKVAPSALARATIDALRSGVEDVYVGDIANDIRARVDVNPKALERELGE